MNLWRCLSRFFFRKYSLFKHLCESVDDGILFSLHQLSRYSVIDKSSELRISLRNVVNLLFSLLLTTKSLNLLSHQKKKKNTDKVIVRMAALSFFFHQHCINILHSISKQNAASEFHFRLNAYYFEFLSKYMRKKKCFENNIVSFAFVYVVWSRPKIKLFFVDSLEPFLLFHTLPDGINSRLGHTTIQSVWKLLSSTTVS